jgi:multidrug efflux system membrane fusion protein
MQRSLRSIGQQGRILRRRWRLLGFCLAWAGVLAGCSHRAPQLAPAEARAIPVSHPVRRVVTDYVDFTGRTDAVLAVDVRARVTGYLMETPFKEGAEVKRDDVLFVVDTRPYQAQLDQAEGQVNRYQAQLELAKTTLARYEGLASSEPGAVSKQALDQYKAQVIEADAALKAAKASLEVYRLNLNFCKVTSPISGQVSRYYLTPGNLVNQDQTLLTTVVSLDPMYAYFDVDEATLLKVNQAIEDGKIVQAPEGRAIPVEMALQGETGFPHRGDVDFINNQVSPTTGSIAFRGVFPNPKSARGVRLLKPGMFVRIRLPMGQPHLALLLIDRAIGSDQGLKFVYVLDERNKAQYRRITVGALQPDGLRVVAGLSADDWVVVGGLQQVRPGMEVRPDQVPMPTLGPGIDQGAGKTPGKTAAEQEGQPTKSTR